MNQHIKDYISLVKQGKYNACVWQKKLVDYIERAFKEEDLHVEAERLENYLRIARYYPFTEVFAWERFCLALHSCTYTRDGQPRWPDMMLLMARGGGKDGFISLESAALISPYNPIPRYNVDICAMNESQARQPFEDLWMVLEDPANLDKLKRFFSWNKEEIAAVGNGSKMKYRTNNPKGKDGLRSGMVVFNEIHAYETYDNLNVFTTGLGKVKDPRILYATTNGDVRDGPLDDKLAMGKAILDGLIEDNGFLPFICALDNKNLVDDPANWEQANPSLPYLPQLRATTEKQYKQWKLDPAKFTAFMTKRMNIPDGDPEVVVALPENILRTKAPIPYAELEGKRAYAGIDFTKSNDMASAGVLIRDGNKRYWVQHSWFCARSADAARIKAPLREWAAKGDLTIVDDEEINITAIVEWLSKQVATYQVVLTGVDNFRYALIRQDLARIGIDAAESKNLVLIRPSDQMRVWTLINSWFLNGLLAVGDVPLFRWAVNNTKLVQAKIDKERGNYTFGKIEQRSRKTDPFMAFVHAACCEVRDNFEDVAAIPLDADTFVW